MPPHLIELIVSGSVGACVGAGVGLLKELRVAEATLGFQHRHEERKKLRGLQSRDKARSWGSPLDWDRRMSQLYEGTYCWMDPRDGDRLHEREYYYHSVIFRFLQLTAIARRFEAEAFYIDPQIAQRGDFDLLRYAKSFLWAMIHAELSPDDGQPGADHFRSDAFRPLLDLAYSTPKTEDGEPVLPETRSRDEELIFDLQRCMAMLHNADALGHRVEIDELLVFFDGIRPDDYAGDGRQRRRWDRLVTLHLFVLAFIDDCGYVWQRKHIEDQTQRAVGMLLYPDTLQQELAHWLPRLGLDNQIEFRRIRCSLEAAVKGCAAESEEQRAARVHDRVQAARRERGLEPLGPVRHAPALMAA
jgi:hypothetical protein